MNIKKIRTLGLILVLLFPMLYLPFSVNADQASNEFNPDDFIIVVDTIEYSDGTKEIITTRNGKTSIEIVDPVRISTEPGLESPVSITANDPSAGEVGADSDCDYFSIYSYWDSDIGDYIYSKFVFHVWCEPKTFTDNLYEFKCGILVAGNTVYQSDKNWHSWPRTTKGFTRTVWHTYIPQSWAGKSYKGWCWAKDDDSYDTDPWDGDSETGVDSCTGTIYPTPTHSVDLEIIGGVGVPFYDDETAVGNFKITNHGNVFSERYLISCPGLDKASVSYSKNGFWVSSGQSTTFSITLDPTDVGTDSFSVKAEAYTYGTTDSVGCSITIIDDDDTPPVVTVEYTGDETDGNPGEIIVTASDASGLLVDPTTSFFLPSDLNTYSYSFEAIDNDNDRLGDRLSTTEDFSIELVDDDIEKPYFANLVITDDHLSLNISFTGIDDINGDDEGLSNVEVFVDGISIHNDSSPSYETAFDFSFSNVGDWIWEPGLHDIQIDITDADNDRPSDSLSNTIDGTFEVTLDEMYQYVMWLCEEINNYIYDNAIVALYGVVTQKLIKIQSLLWEAYQLIQDGYLHTGLVRQKMAEIKLEIADTKTELMINKQSMRQEHFDHLQECIRDVRNRIVELMGLGISEFSHAISLVEIDVYNLRDFVEENIPAADSENLVNAITLTAAKLENAIFDISLDKSTEASLTSAQNALNNVWIQVIALAGKGKISEDLLSDIVEIIIPIVAEIEELKLIF